jgi:hypothetical protein
MNGIIIMKIILVSTGNLQEYIIDNIQNLKLFGNNDIVVITEKPFFNKLKDLDITLIDSAELDDCDFNNKSKLNKHFRNGFWHLCSLRFFYLYSYIKKNQLTDCIHLENDVMSYIHFDKLKTCFKHNKVYATFDSDTRVIPSILYIPNYEAFKPIVDNYNEQNNDMENLARFDETVIVPFPIYSNHENINKFNKNFDDFHCVFDGAAIGQYLGGIDPRNQPGDTRGFVNETCIVKYNNNAFFWVLEDGLYCPYILINNYAIKVINLHIHSKQLNNFMSDNPKEELLIKKLTNN